MNFLVMGRHEAERLTLDAPYGVISFIDPRAPLPSLPHDAMRDGHITIACFDYSTLANMNPEGLRVFSTIDANTVIDFVEHLNSKSIETCIIHCERGVSRSRGCALALSLIYGDSEKHRELGMPNAIIVYRILEAYRARYTTIEAVPPIIRKTRYIDGVRMPEALSYDLLAGVNDLLTTR